MNKILSSAILVVLLSSNAVYAFDWNVASNLFNKAIKAQNNTQTPAYNAADLVSALTEIQKQSEEVDKNVQTTFLDLVSNLSSTQEAYNMGNLFDAILSNEEKTQSQKSGMISQLMSEYVSNLMADKTAAANNIKNLPWTQKTSVIEDVASLLKSGQDYAVLAKNSINTATNVVNTASKVNDVANTIISIHQTASELKTKAQTVANVVSQLRQIASAAGVSL